MISTSLALCGRNQRIFQEKASKQSFDVYFDASQDKLLNKQSIYWLFETPWCSYDINVMV